MTELCSDVPTVYALHHPEDGVTAWAFALPGGPAIIVPIDEDGTASRTGLIHTSLDHVMTFWAPLKDTDLVQVTDRRTMPSPSVG